MADCDGRLGKKKPPVETWDRYGRLPAGRSWCDVSHADRRETQGLPGEGNLQLRRDAASSPLEPRGEPPPTSAAPLDRKSVV